MLNLQRIRYVTSHYQELQGLRIVPLGIWLCLVALGEAAGYIPATQPQIAAITMFAYLGSGFFVLAAYGWVGKIYERQYGSVHPLLQARPRALSGCLSGAGFLFVLYVGIMLGSQLLAVEVTMLLAALLLYAAWRSRWYRKDYLVLLVLLIGVSSLSSNTLIMGLNGATVIAGGLLDHLLLVRTLKQVPEEGHAGSI